MANETQPVEKKQNYIIDIANDENGKIQIANGVVAAIIQKYVLSVEGVTRLAPQGIMDGLTSIFSRRGYDSNINIETTEDGASISLALNMKFGCDIPAVSAEIQKLLREKVPAITGYKVSKVNIMVAAIEEEIPEEPADKDVVPVQTI